MKNTATIIFQIPNVNLKKELEVPLSMSANEFCRALITTYLHITDEKELYNCYLKSENPIALIRGMKTLGDFGLRNGSIVTCDK